MANSGTPSMEVLTLEMGFYTLSRLFPDCLMKPNIRREYLDLLRHLAYRAVAASCHWVMSFLSSLAPGDLELGRMFFWLPGPTRQRCWSGL